MSTEHFDLVNYFNFIILILKMRVQVILVLILTLLSCIAAKEELLLVLEVSRHGARAPGKIYHLAKNPE